MTIDTHCQISSSIPSSSTLAVLERAYKLPLSTAVSCLPRKHQRTETEFPRLSPCERLTLFALGGILRPGQAPLAGDQVMTVSLEMIADITCLSRATTIKHIESLARAGWIAALGWTRTDLSYSLSPAIWLHAELMRLKVAPNPKEAAHAAALSKTLVHAIHLHLTQSRAKFVPHRRKAESLSPASVRVLDLVRAAVDEAQRGDDPTATLSKVLAAGKDLYPRQDLTPSVPPPPPSPASEPVPTPVPTPAPARESPELYLAKKKLRDELFIAAVRLGKQETIQEIVRMGQDTQVSITDLEAKLATLRALLKHAKASGRTGHT